MLLFCKGDLSLPIQGSPLDRRLVVMGWCTRPVFRPTNPSYTALASYNAMQTMTAAKQLVRTPKSLPFVR